VLTVYDAKAAGYGYGYGYGYGHGYGYYGKPHGYGPPKADEAGREPSRRPQLTYLREKLASIRKSA
jgi:hypothetical protein